MEQDVVLNKNTTMEYYGRHMDRDGTCGHLYFVPNKNPADGLNSPAPHHLLPESSQVKSQEKEQEQEQTVENKKGKGKRTEDKLHKLEPTTSSRKSDVPTYPTLSVVQLQAALDLASRRYGPELWSLMSMEQQMAARDIEAQLIFGKSAEAESTHLAPREEKKAKALTQPKETQSSVTSSADGGITAAAKVAKDKRDDELRAKLIKIREDKQRRQTQAAASQISTPSSSQAPARTPRSARLTHDDPSEVSSDNVASATTPVNASSTFPWNPYSDEEVFVQPILIAPPILTSRATPEASSSRSKVKSNAAKMCAPSVATPAADPVSDCLIKSDTGLISSTFQPADVVHNQTDGPRRRPSVLISPTFDTIIVDPKDLSILRLLLDDLERRMTTHGSYGNGSNGLRKRLWEHLKECWDRWQPLLEPLLANMDQGPASELARIHDEIEVALEQSHRRDFAQKQFLKVLITVAYRYSVPAVHQIRGCGSQTKCLSQMEAEVREGAEKITQLAWEWSSAVLSSVRIMRQKPLTDLVRATLNQDMVGTELEERLGKAIFHWIFSCLQPDVQKHVAATRRAIARAHDAFRKQLATDMHVSNVVQFLPSLLTAYIRSVGVMLDASIHVRFGEVVQSFKAVYMKTIEADPLKAYKEPLEFVRKWSKVHDALLKMLMLKDTFHVRAPSPEEVILAAKSYGLPWGSIDEASDTEGELQEDIDSGDTGLTPDGTRSLSQNQEDSSSTKSVPGAVDQTTLKNTGDDKESTPASSSSVKHERTKDKWFKRTVARMKKLLRR